jgi:addiction module HigA family antidote
MTTLNNRDPKTVTHPGWLLRRNIEYRRISQHKLAEMIGVDYKIVHEIVNERRPIDAEFNMLVAAALGVSETLYVNMQNRYDRITARNNKELAARVAKIKESNAGAGKNTATVVFNNAPANHSIPAMI